MSTSADQTHRAALAYFAIVFWAGALLGPIREFALAPALGAMPAVLVEAPVMLAACWLAARWTMRRWRSDPLRLGVFALGLLLTAEVAGSLTLRGLTIAQYLAHLATPPGLLSLALFLAFGLMPLAVSRTNMTAPAME